MCYAFYKTTKTIIVTTVCGLLLVQFLANGQDIHYSQFYTDYLRLNPASVGHFDGDYRVGANARSQWGSFTVPYQTVSGYADFGVYNSPAGDRLGLGLRMLYDQAGDGILSTSEFQGAVSFQKALGSKAALSAGFGAMFTQKAINWNKLYFSSQWNENDFNLNAPSGETPIANSFWHLDLQAGARLNIRPNEVWNAYISGAILHLNKPATSFFNADNQMGIRALIAAGANFELGQLSFDPALCFTTQKKASEFLIGSNVSWLLSSTGPKHTIRAPAGAWYRLKDAAVALVGVEYNRYRILFSCDITLSSLQPYNKGRGGPEISIVHVGSFNRQPSKKIYCPRF